MLLFQPFLLPEANEANTYIIGCRKTRKVLLIDAGADTPDYDRFLEEQNAELIGIFLTHLHWDHTDGLETILKRHDVLVYSLTGETTNGEKVSEGECIQVGNIKTRVLKTSGHTPESASLVVENRMVFVGDALFAGSIGGTSSERANREEKENIRTKLFTLPDETLICSGHGPITTVGIEKYSNPFFCDDVK